MAKISFTSITPIKSKDDVNIVFNDKTIIIKQYLPIKEKAELIDYIIQSTFDSKGLFSPIRLSIYTNIGLLKWYTNINFTDTMMINIEKTYDALILNKLDTIIKNINEEELTTIMGMIKDAIIETKDYLRSFAGQLQAAQADYNIANFDMKEIEKTLQDPNQVGFVREVMEKMG